MAEPDASGRPRRGADRPAPSVGYRLVLARRSTRSGAASSGSGPRSAAVRTSRATPTVGRPVAGSLPGCPTGPGSTRSSSPTTCRSSRGWSSSATGRRSSGRAGGAGSSAASAASSRSGPGGDRAAVEAYLAAAHGRARGGRGPVPLPRDRAARRRPGPPGRSGPGSPTSRCGPAPRSSRSSLAGPTSCIAAGGSGSTSWRPSRGGPRRRAAGLAAAGAVVVARSGGSRIA